MKEEKSKKELLREEINNKISNSKQRVEYLERYKVILDTPIEKFITEHLETGKKLINIEDKDILELDTELLIRLLLK